MSLEIYTTETVVLSCPGSIEIISAQIGRMRTGKCVHTDFGSVGCGREVTDFASRLCSGQKTCEVGPALYGSIDTGCPDELNVYLLITYACVDELATTGKAEYLTKLSRKIRFKMHTTV